MCLGLFYVVFFFVFDDLYFINFSVLYVVLC